MTKRKDHSRMQTFKQQLTSEVQAHTGVTLCRSEDEERVEQHARETADQLEYDLWVWNTAMGLRCHTDPNKTPEGEEAAMLRDPSVFLGSLLSWQRGAALVVSHDLVSIANSGPGGIPIARILRTVGQLQRALSEDASDESAHERAQKAFEAVEADLHQLRQAYNQGDEKELSEKAERLAATASVLQRQYEVPREDRTVQLIACDSEELSRPCGAGTITMELPDRNEIRQILDTFVDQREAICEDPDKVLDAMAGLMEFQIHKALLLSFVDQGEIDPTRLQQFKKSVLQAQGITWIDPDERGFDAIGGLEPFKEWLEGRAATFTQEAAEYGVEPARGVVVAGIPGGGKSALAKTIPAIWRGVPLLYLDVGATRGRFHGQSEQTLARAFQIADAVAGTDGGACVLWIDEGEKAFAGGAGSADLDSGVAARTLQQFLTWLQEHKSRVWTYMTANRPDALPPELLRAGRFDGLWWVDYPAENERRAICRIYRDRYQKAAGVDIELLVQHSADRTGAEIELAFKEAAIYAMLKRHPQIETADVVHQLDLLPKTSDTFKPSPELENWKRTAMKANATDPVRLQFQKPVVVDATGGSN